MHVLPLLNWFHVGILALVLSGLIVWVGGGGGWDWSLWNFEGRIGRKQLGERRILQTHTRCEL